MPAFQNVGSDGKGSNEETRVSEDKAVLAKEFIAIFKLNLCELLSNTKVLSLKDSIEIELIGTTPIAIALPALGRPFPLCLPASLWPSAAADPTFDTRAHLTFRTNFRSAAAESSASRQA
jgi:hypothetical protein